MKPTDSDGIELSGPTGAVPVLKIHGLDVSVLSVIVAGNVPDGHRSEDGEPKLKNAEDVESGVTSILLVLVTVTKTVEVSVSVSVDDSEEASKEDGVGKTASTVVPVADELLGTSEDDDGYPYQNPRVS